MIQETYEVESFKDYDDQQYQKMIQNQLQSEKLIQEYRASQKALEKELKFIREFNEKEIAVLKRQHEQDIEKLKELYAIEKENERDQTFMQLEFYKKNSKKEQEGLKANLEDCKNQLRLKRLELDEVQNIRGS